MDNKLLHLLLECLLSFHQQLSLSKEKKPNTLNAEADILPYKRCQLLV